MNPMFYFLVALTAVLAVTASPGEWVLDTDGTPIFRSERYYVLPVFPDFKYGGLNLSSRGDNQCPLFVGLVEPNFIHGGIPVKFSNWKSKSRYLLESENVNIMMDFKPLTCVQSTYWLATAAPSLSRGPAITVGPIPEAGEDSSRSFFQIVKSVTLLRGYDIMFCPNGNDCRHVNKITDEYYVRRLVVSSEPFPFVFIRDRWRHWRPQS